MPSGEEAFGSLTCCAPQDAIEQRRLELERYLRLVASCTIPCGAQFVLQVCVRARAYGGPCATGDPCASLARQRFREVDDFLCISTAMFSPGSPVYAALRAPARTRSPTFALDGAAAGGVGTPAARPPPAATRAASSRQVAEPQVRVTRWAR